jgi:hypothetical protein
MSGSSPHPPSWTDAQLAEAVKASTHWVSVMRELGFGERASSAGAIRIVRRRADELGLDSSHFLGKRRWSDAELRHAVSESTTWNEVLMRLGLSTNSGAPPHVKANAIRLGLDTSHLNQLSHVGRQRVQVKTTTFFTKYGWAVGVGHHPDTHAKKRGRRVAYDPDVIDLFFVIDGDLTMYLIPSRAIAGRVQVLVRTYKKYIVGNAAGLLAAAAAIRPTAGEASA